MRLGSMPCPFNAGNAEAPQSMSSAALAVSRKKQVLSRPPEPKASPEPTIVRRIMLAARPRRHRGVPAFHMSEVFRHNEPRRLHEIDRHQRGDIGDRIAIAGDEFALGQFLVQQFEEPDRARPHGLGIGRHLRHFQCLHRRMQMAEHRRHVGKEIDLAAPVPHFHQRDLFRRRRRTAAAAAAVTSK